jgi:hypothetical protein
MMPAYTGDPADPHRPPYEPPLTKQEIQRWAHERFTEPVDGGAVVQPIPAVGDLVTVRFQPWGPTVPARVLAVQPVDVLRHPDWAGGDVDPNLFTEDDAGRWAPKWDPWPDVELETLPGKDRPHELRGGQVARCKEARVRGSCGWLWPGHRWDTPWQP